MVEKQDKKWQADKVGPSWFPREMTGCGADEQSADTEDDMT